jgi:hypothetical protein
MPILCSPESDHDSSQSRPKDENVIEVKLFLVWAVKAVIRFWEFHPVPKAASLRERPNASLNAYGN